MPKTVETANIEEVLSSIRRLVSDDFSRKSALRGGLDAEGRLMLTPALRIAGETSAPSRQETVGTAAEPEILDPIPVAGSGATWEDVSLEDRILKLESAVSMAGGEWDPDGSEKEAGPKQAANRTSGRLHLSSPVLPAERPEAGLDLDWLRDLIAQTIRQELKGEIGERISQNLRKMVRREIARALAERDIK